MAQHTLASVAITMQANSAAIVNAFGEARSAVQQFGRSMDTLKKRAMLVYAAIAAVNAIKNTTQAVVGAAATFESLNASLETVYASSERAAAKFDELRQFAAETPSTLEEVTQAAILMRSMGLDPSIESMESISNTAAAMGKTVLDFTHAIADAITFEMERLKEFGITAKQNADTIDFMFQGVKTTVKRDAESINKYLLDIGKTKFAGGMARQAETLNGKFSQLSGAVQNLAAKFADETGLTKAVKSATVALTDMANKGSAAIDALAKGETIADLRTRLRELNKDLKIGQRIMEESGGKKGAAGVARIEEEKKAIKERIDVLRQEQNEKIRIIKEQEAVEEEARQKRLDALKKEAEAKRLAAEAEALEKEKRAAFGGDAEGVFERIQEQYATELEMLNKHLEDKQELMKNFAKYEIGTEKERATLVNRIAKKHIDDTFKLQQKEDAKLKAHKDKFMGHMLSANVKGSKAMLSVQKAFRVAEAVMEGKSAVMSAYKWGNSVGGPVVGAAFAATAAAFSASQVAAIISGGESSATSAATGAASPPDVSTPGLDDLAANDDEPATTKTITVAFEGEGELVPRSVLRELAEELNSLDDSNVRISI